MIRDLDSLRRMFKGRVQRYIPWLITCREFEGFILEYYEGTLPDDQRRIFERHMRYCRECREYLAAYRRSIEIGRSILGEPDDAIPGDVPEDLVQAILVARGR